MADKTLLVTRPKHDDCTEYLAYYASLIIKKAQEYGINVKDFEGKQASYRNVSKFVSKKNPYLIFVNGHGDNSSLEGHEGEIIFSVNKDIDLLKNKIMYARACNAGIHFGKMMVKDNNGCFVGYKTPFSFWNDGRYSAVPSRDKTAKLFLEPSNQFMNFLISGHSTKIAHEKSKKLMVDNMKKVLVMKNQKEPGALAWLEVLWNNYEGQVLLGNPEMTINS